MQLEETLYLILRIILFLAGFLLVTSTVIAAIKSFVLPRGIDVWLTRITFRTVHGLFHLRLSNSASYAERDRIMAFFAPFTLVLLPAIMLTLVLLGYALMYWAVSPMTAYEAFRLSGSSLLTLGYASNEAITFKILEFSEALLGLILIALLIAYLPTMYAAFSKRETAVALLESYAGTPPMAVELIGRVYRTGELENLREFWVTWQIWFAEIEESHTSLSALAFFRSPQPERSWITAAGTVMDAAALMLSTIDVHWEPRAAFCLRNGYLALRQIANFFHLTYVADPQPDDPISISKQEFDEVCDLLELQGVPLRTNRDKAWQDFAGWRVNYDTVLIKLANFTMAPYAPWSSDRSPVHMQD